MLEFLQTVIRICNIDNKAKEHVNGISKLTSTLENIINLLNELAMKADELDPSAIEILKLLIDADVDVNCKQNGWTSLMMAAKKGHTDVVNSLIDAGAEVKHETLIKYGKSFTPEALNALAIRAGNLDDKTLEALKNLFIKKYDNGSTMEQGLSSLASEIYIRKSRKTYGNMLFSFFNTNTIKNAEKMKAIKESGVDEIIGKINTKRGWFSISQASVESSKFVNDCIKE